eukprot:gene2044-3974_t
MSSLIDNLADVQRRISATAANINRNPSEINLVAVSKTKPAEDLMEIYNAGHRIFGENYVQELIEKANKLPGDIRWHFIGHLQSSKVKSIIRDVPNLEAIETVDSEKLAIKLNNALTACKPVRRLDVYVQVNTSEEDTKSGVPASEVLGIVACIRDKCPSLKLKGLMTIGASDDVSCFDKLVECRADVAAFLGVDPTSLGLSMGMSGDFEEAIMHGATSVRVGSTLFGAREYKTDK